MDNSKKNNIIKRTVRLFCLAVCVLFLFAMPVSAAPKATGTYNPEAAVKFAQDITKHLHYVTGKCAWYCS